MEAYWIPLHEDNAEAAFDPLVVLKVHSEIKVLIKYKNISDGSGHGLRPRTARTKGILGGPRPPEDRSSKTKRPAGLFGPKIS